MIQVEKVKWCMKQTSDKGLSHIWYAHLDKHETSDQVMISVVGSIPTGGNLILLKLSYEGCPDKILQ